MMSLVAAGAPGEPSEEAAVLRRQRLLGHRKGPRVAEAADLAAAEPWGRHAASIYGDLDGNWMDLHRYLWIYWIYIYI